VAELAGDGKIEVANKRRIALAVEHHGDARRHHGQAHQHNGATAKEL
jgi:hypothetical protein